MKYLKNVANPSLIDKSKNNVVWFSKSTTSVHITRKYPIKISANGSGKITVNQGLMNDKYIEILDWGGYNFKIMRDESADFTENTTLYKAYRFVDNYGYLTYVYPLTEDIEVIGEHNNTQYVYDFDNPLTSVNSGQQVTSDIKTFQLSTHAIEQDLTYESGDNQILWSDTPIVTVRGNGSYNEPNTTLTFVEFPVTVTSVTNFAFCYCTALQNFVIPNTITTIEDYAFDHCSALTNINLPNSITSIGVDGFSFCTALNNFVFPSLVTEINASILLSCTSLTSVTIHNNISIINQSAFNGCTALVQISLPQSINEIGYSVFRNCDTLTEITFPDNVTEVGQYTLSQCDNLTTLYLGENTTKLTYSSCEGCKKLATIYFRGIAYTSKTALTNALTAVGGSVASNALTNTAMQA